MCSWTQNWTSAIPEHVERGKQEQISLNYVILLKLENHKTDSLYVFREGNIFSVNNEA